MLLKHIYKAISFSLLFASSFAQKTCEDLNINYVDKCYFDSDDNLIQIDIDTNYQPLNQFESLFSHTSLNILTLRYFDFTQELIDKIASLPNLVALELTNFKIDEEVNFDPLNDIGYVSMRTNLIQKIAPFQNLAKLVINEQITQDDVNTLSTFTDISSLVMENINVHGLNLDKLANLSGLTELTLNFVKFPSFPKFVYSLTNLRSLDINADKGLVIPDEIYNLVNLQYLDLSNNYLTQISPNIGNLENLTTLYLQFNKLTSLPKEIGNLKNLEELNLANNQINYIPKEVTNLKNLKILYLEYNQIKKIPEWLRYLTELEILNLSYNNIYSTIPDSLNNLINLKEFYIQGNANIEGKALSIDGLFSCEYSEKYEICVEKGKEIPCLDPNLNFEICASSIKDEAKISTNGLCGPENGKCPDDQCCNKDGKCSTSDDECLAFGGCQYDYGACVDECEEIFNYMENRDPGSFEINVEKCLINESGKMKALYINEMKVDQFLINYLSKLTDLEEWGCDYCSYSNKTDYSGLKNLTKLSTIHIYSKEGEKFTDVPDFVKDIPTLKRLIIRSNNLNSIPDSISNFKDLEYLDLYNNEIQNIPSGIENLRNLKYLDLSANKLTGFSDSIGKLQNLEYLYLYENDITEIPDSIGNLSRLQFINLSDNLITSVSDGLYSIKNVTSLDLSNNKIKSISDKIDNFTELKFLSLAGNALTKIPTTLQYNKKLQHLDLDDNRLSYIPEYLSKLENLEYINLGNNKIYSELPSSLNSLTKLKEIYLDGNLNIKGRTLTINSLEKCYYSDHYDLCIAKTMDCFNDDARYDKCASEELPISTNGNCNSSDGRCPYGQCCNPSGRCVADEESCLIKNGCNSEFGFCIDECHELYNMVMNNSEYDLIGACSVTENGTMKSLKFKGFKDDYQPYIDKVGSFTDLEELSFYGMDLEDLNFKSITNLKNIKTIHIGGYLENALVEIPDFIYSLKSLTTLEIQYNNITTIPDDIVGLQNLEVLDMEENHLFKIPYYLSELRNLQHLRLHYNKLYSSIPEELNDLPKLKSIYLYGNINIKGKTLINDSLEDCRYDPNYTLCMPKDMKCMEEGLYHVCTEEDEIETDEDECDQIYTYVRSVLDIKKNDFTDIIKECFINKKGKVKSLVLGTIVNPQGFINNIVNLPEIEELTFDSLRYKTGLKFDSLKKLRKLTTLKFIQYYKKALTEIPDAIFTLKNLEVLIIDDQKITTIPDDINKLENLKTLKIVYNDITEIPSAIGDLKNLETIELNSNRIDGEIPESFNSLPNLKKFLIFGNKDITGKALANENVEVCEYEEQYSLCIETSVKCIENSFYEFKSCSELKNDEDQIQDLTTDMNCGFGKGRCPAGQCCSAFGWCGTSDQHCLIRNGCQTGFGDCKGDNVSKASINGKCGVEDGRCPEGQCCSKNGECGNTDDHCNVEAGCQYEFGKCVSAKISFNGKCGLTDGKCPDEQCCSKDGICTNDEVQCSTTNGCQLEFGTCTEEYAISKGQCGEGFGSCPQGQCCSKYGWCGKDSQYCGPGCQSQFGICE